MSDDLMDKFLDYYSEIIRNTPIPKVCNIKPLESPIDMQVGGFVGADDCCIFDLRLPDQKGYLPETHPIVIRAKLESCLAQVNKELRFKLIKDLSQESHYNDFYFTNTINESIDVYEINDLFAGRAQKNKNIILKNALFTSSNLLIHQDYFKLLDADNLYIELGFGTYLVLHSGSRKANQLSSFQALYLNYFLRFIEEVLIRNAKGRLGDIVKKLKLNHYGLYSPRESISTQSNLIYIDNTRGYINIPFSLSDEHIEYLSEIIHAK